MSVAKAHWWWMYQWWISPEKKFFKYSWIM